jgi:hypothetical protein
LRRKHSESAAVHRVEIEASRVAESEVHDSQVIPRPDLPELEGFLHIRLTLHQLKHISSYSTPDFILDQLPSVGKTMRDAILKTLEKPPFWVTLALSWILFVLRLLKPQELSVGIALLSTTPASLLERGVDEGMIPREIGVDLKRELSPLLDVERGEIRIFHTYF